MAQLDTTNTFVDGNTVNAANLNNLIDQSFALDGIIESQTAMGGTVIDPAADEILIRDATGAGNKLRRAFISQLPGAGTVTGVHWDAAYPAPISVFLGNVTGPTADAKIQLSMKVQTANKVLASPTSGTGTPGFRALVPADLPVGTIAIALADIDWSFGLVFTKTLTGPITFTFSNPSLGQTIRVRVTQLTYPPGSAATVTWPITPLPLYWAGGVHPVMTTRSGAVDIYTFTFINGAYYGTFAQDFKP